MTVTVSTSALRIFTMVLRFEDHWACSSTVPRIMTPFELSSLVVLWCVLKFIIFRPLQRAGWC